MDYFAGRGLEKFEGRKKRWVLMASILANIGMLSFFKYFNFANENLAALAEFIGWNYPIEHLSIILPIGLSFHTFQSLSYTIEVYRGHQKAERHFGYLALYVMYYPQLVAGPIERPQNVLHQLHDGASLRIPTRGRRAQADGVGHVQESRRRGPHGPVCQPGLQRPDQPQRTRAAAGDAGFCHSDLLRLLGLFGHRAGLRTGDGREADEELRPSLLRPLDLGILAALAHLPFHLVPRLCVHPAGRQPRPESRAGYSTSFITFLISGLWHGANWTYVIWGALHGFYLSFPSLTESMLERLSALTRLDKLPRLKTAISTLTTFSLVTFAWIFFRATTLAMRCISRQHLVSGWPSYLAQSWQLLQEGGRKAAESDVYSIVNAVFTILTPLTEETRTVIVLTTLALYPAHRIEVLQYRGNFLEQLHQKPVYLRRVIYASLIAVILILGTSYASVQQAFIYFQF